MGNFVKVAQQSEIPEGTGKRVELGGKEVAVFNSGGNFYAIENTCCHRGGPLAEGDVDGTTVTCPWHGWEYNITTGQNLDDEKIKVARFNVKLEGDDVLIET